MTSNDYLYIYANEKDGRYFLFSIQKIAIKISRCLSKKVTLNEIDKNRYDMLDDKFNITDYVFRTLLTELQHQNSLAIIFH